MTTAASAAPAADFADWLRRRAQTVENRLAAAISAAAAPPPLDAAMRHAALGGGKRLRPALLFAVTNCADSPAPAPQAVAAACALELIHCYSLAHDDLPCMDDDDSRRGKPSCHKAHGEGMALLAGDCLHSLAFSLLAASGLPAIACAHLADAAGASGMGGGQAIDIAAAAATEEDLAAMHRKKTGALFHCALQLGLLCAPQTNTPANQLLLQNFAQHFGLLYQIANDLADEQQDKTAGKTTYVTLLSPAAAAARARQTQDAALAALAGNYPRLARIARAVYAPAA